MSNPMCAIAGASLLLLAGGCVFSDGDRRELPPPAQDRLIEAGKDGCRCESGDIQLASTAEKPLPYNVLAISGGGSYGAFDVGVLQGWSASGNRPVFDMVTGVSTGALIATFAFLGAQYDDFLRDAYVKATADEVYELRWFVSILNSDSIARSEPLKKRIDAAITPKLLKEIAQEHAKGRRLYVGTTNLDTRRFVVWDMGAIASSDTADALTLYRQIVLASASVPVFFPPVLIDVEVNGVNYQELHVDGGTTSAVFVPPLAGMRDRKRRSNWQGSNVYVISSGKLYADSDMAKRQFCTLTGDAISAMQYAGARNDIVRIFNMAHSCGMDFQLISIPQDFPLNSHSQVGWPSLPIDSRLSFDPVELLKLYDLGFEMGKTCKGWRQSPPGSELSEQTPPRTGKIFKTEK